MCPILILVLRDSSNFFKGVEVVYLFIVFVFFIVSATGWGIHNSAEPLFQGFVN